MSHNFEKTWGEFYEDCKVDNLAQRSFRTTHALKVLTFVFLAFFL